MGPGRGWLGRGLGHGPGRGRGRRTGGGSPAMPTRQQGCSEPGRDGVKVSVGPNIEPELVGTSGDVWGLEVGRPLKVVPFPGPWSAARAWSAPWAWLAGPGRRPGAVRLVPDRLAVAGSMDAATVGVKSSRPAARSWLPARRCPAGRCRGTGSVWLEGLSWLVADPWPALVGRWPAGCPGMACWSSWVPWWAIVWLLACVPWLEPIYGTTGPGQLPTCWQAPPSTPPACGSDTDANPIRSQRWRSPGC
jgi:hypothetical protein